MELRGTLAHHRRLRGERREMRFQRVFSGGDFRLHQLRRFRQLQQRITGLEESIADRRELYNDEVNINNTRIDQFPDALIARRYGFTAKPLLEFAAAEKTDVDVGAMFKR